MKKSAPTDIDAPKSVRNLTFQMILSDDEKINW